MYLCISLNSRDAVANIAMHEPCNVARTMRRVAGGQSVVDKAQKRNIFVKVSSPLRVRQTQSCLLTFGRLALRSVLDLRVWARSLDEVAGAQAKTLGSNGTHTAQTARKSVYRATTGDIRVIDLLVRDTTHTQYEVLVREAPEGECCVCVSVSITITYLSMIMRNSCVCAS